VLLASAKSTFFAGAELKGVLQLKAEDAAPGFGRIEAMKRSFRRIETLGRPVVALLNGAALGGGWELALVAHARFALDDRRIRFGMPEVSLGLIPGATGITKTVRLLGLMAAQPYLLEGKLFDPREALGLGLVDGLADSAEGLRAAALAWIAAHPTRCSHGTARTTGCPAARRARRRSPAPGGCAGDAREEDARPLSGDPGDPRDDGRGRAGRLRHGDPHREPQAREGDGRADDEEPRDRILLRPERDQVGPVATGRFSALEAGPGRRARCRHDGCGHRPCEMPRAASRAC
jgi:enoyl-CoA hydratase/carnithine racemase